MKGKIEEAVGNCILNYSEDFPYITFPIFDKYKDIITHCFTTRIGGVSKEPFNSLNLGFSKPDDKESVLENYKIVANSVGLNTTELVLSNQIHEKRFW